MDRIAWLKDRQQGIGGTDIASIAGVGFLSPEEVYAEKVAAEPVDRAPSPVMAMGSALENHNAELYAARTGRPLLSPGLVRTEVVPWAFATFDRVSLCADAWAAPVELKYTPFFGDEWGPDGSDHVRDGYIVQATWQLVILRIRGHAVSQGDISAIDGYGNHRVYSITYDDDLAELLLDLGEGFWQRVQSRAGLDGWEPKVRSAIAERLAAIHPDASVVLGDDAVLLTSSYLYQKAIAKDAEELADSYKRQLLAMLGTAETGLLPDGRRIRQRELTRKSYTVAETKYRDFRILAPKKEKPNRE